MSDFFDPNGTLIRLIRGTTYATADHQVNKARALSPFSAVAAAAYGRGREHERRPPQRRRPGSETPSLDDEEAVRVDFHAADARLIIRTIIAALAASGETLEQERRHVLAYLHDAGSTPAEIAFAEAELRHPAAVEEITGPVASRETAVEIYAAALLATKAASESSRAFLARLAAGLNLEPEFVRDLHAKWDDPPPT
ncbi:MAG: DUF533 domain-containing protein [Alphaproteobacteria bacterium]|nr:DUF533 domain-containing protein [Alphaproteobacteria bacterium]